MSKHTPTPWRVYENEFEDIGVTTASAELEDSDGDGYDICKMENEGVFGKDVVRANAAYIVKCVNAHADLVAALEDIREIIADKTCPDDATRMKDIAAAVDRAALSKAAL